jgi:hypothetical protein
MLITTEAMATDIAQKKIEHLAAEVGDRFDIVPGETRCVDLGWIFFYNSADYIRTGNPMDSLVGNGPILVLRDGRIIQLPTSVPWEEALKEILSE